MAPTSSHGSAAPRSAPWDRGRSRAPGRPSAGCPREPPGRCLRAPAAHVELPDQRRAARADDGGQPAESGGRWTAEVVDREVLSDRELEYEAAPLPVLGNVPEPGVEVALDASPGDIGSLDRDRAAHELRSRSSRRSAPSGRCRRSRRCPRISPGVHLERDSLTFSIPRSSRTWSPSTSEQRARRLGTALLSTRSRTSRPTIRRARLASVAPSAGRVSISFSAAQHGDPVGDLGHLVQLVADEDDRRAL